MNLATIIDDHPDASVALVSRGRGTTYGELRASAAALRRGFTDLGVGPGDRVAIVAANNPLFVTAYLGALGARAVAVPLNPASPAAELERELAAVEARVVVVGAAGRDAIASVDRDGARIGYVVAPDGVSVGGATSFEELLAGGESPIVEREDDDLAVLMFTSGTAGSPRAAKLTHGNLRSNLEQLQSTPGRTLSADDVALGVLPLFHIFGLNVQLGLALYTGSTVVLVERFDPASALQTVQDHGVTLVAGAPPMFAAWAGMPGLSGTELSGVRLAVSGAAPLPNEVADAFELRFGLELRQGYGLTEASPVVTSSVVDGPPKRGSIGLPIPGVTVRLVDDEGEDALEADPGEIWVQGPNVFAGYWRDDIATHAVLADGWLRTGDVAVTDDDGYLYLVDRAKDLVIVSGFNVFPAEVEAVLLEHPGISEAVVVGVAHPHTGEAVKAFVVPASGTSLEEDEVIAHCTARLARYKCPTKVMFVDELPHGTTGKVLRRELRS